uniref:Phospholipase C n=1 Tax=Leersia perrieri TaxID=77586 RepID=A0A0D9XTS4_9ORYZ
MAGKIKTIVVLVQENRSFDHMLGWMKSLNPEIDGVTGAEFNHAIAGDATSPKIHFVSGSEYVDPDPGHSFQAIYEQVYGDPYTWGVTSPATKPGVDTPPMSGFAQQADKEIDVAGNKVTARTVMSGFSPNAVPVYRELVREFAVCDRWFASVPTSTQPNRMFVHSATSHGLVSNDGKLLRAGMPQRTIFDALHDAGHTFGIYYQFPPAVLYYRNMRKLKYWGNYHPYDIAFKRDCKHGKLPNYVVIEQRYLDKLKPLHLPGNDDHPSHDVSEGQRLVKEVYESLRSSPQWHETLLVIVYDEHGGFFDHVPTPVTGVPSPDGIVSADPVGFRFDRLGVRVPAILVSPWIEPGTVLHRPVSGPDPTSQFEHSSIPATVKKIFGLGEFLTKRDAWAGTFETVLTREKPREDCPVTMPEPVRMREASTADAGERGISEFQAELVELAAAINGDHEKEGLVEGKGMTVADADAYCREVFERFMEECRRCRDCGMDESHVPMLQPGASGVSSKLCACFPCFK